MGIYRRAFHHIDTELDTMERYVETVRTSLKNAHAQNAASVRNQIARMSSEAGDQFCADVAEDDICLGDLFPALSSSSTLVAIMSFVEHEFAFICRQVEHATGKTKTTRFQNPFIKKCKDRLNELTIDVPEDALWSEILHLQETRNVIVHQLGELYEFAVSGSRDFEVHDFLKERADATIVQSFEDGPLKIVLTHDLCIAAIETIREFFKRVVGLIPRELYSKPTGSRDDFN